MPIKNKIYLDTSIPSAYYDTKNLERQKITHWFWNRLELYEVFISDLVIEEINATKDKKLKNKLLILTNKLNILSTDNNEVRTLAEEYILREIIPPKYIADAIHIAVAVVNSLDILVSWNFEHIVKLKTKKEVNVINVLFGYKQFEIAEPAML